MSTDGGAIDPAETRLPFYNPLDQTGPKHWNGYTLLMPVCSVGNVVQLACDLIISTLLHRREAHLAGRIHSPALMAVVGPNPYAKCNPSAPPTTSTEVYVSDKRKLVVIQQRTSYFKELKHIYVKELINWIKEAAFGQVIVLSSSFSQCNPDLTQLGKFGSPCDFMHSIVTKQFDQDKSEWKNLNLKPLEDKRKIEVVRDGLSFLPGSGLTKSLLKAFEKSSIPAAFLIAFCSEGINIQDCYEVANVVNKFLGLIDNTGIKQDSMTMHDPTLDQTLLRSTLLEVDGDQDNNHQTNLWIEPYSWKCY